MPVHLPLTTPCLSGEWLRTRFLLSLEPARRTFQKRISHWFLLTSRRAKEKHCLLLPELLFGSCNLPTQCEVYVHAFVHSLIILDRTCLFVGIDIRIHFDLKPKVQIVICTQKSKRSQERKKLQACFFQCALVDAGVLPQTLYRLVHFKLPWTSPGGQGCVRQ